jgi:zinc transport system ATP-binding protein
MMGLDDRSEAAIGELSGGQLQRTLLGRAIISNPELLVLDEPLSYIDKHFEHHLYDIIGELAKSTTIVLVSHEMSAIAGMANRHIIVDNGIHECSAHHHYVPSECDE